MGQAQQKRRAVLIVEDDAELRGLAAALLEDGELDTIECESAEAALAINDLTDSSTQGLKYLRDRGMAQTDEESITTRSEP
jgi:CheY-like chemotaxis protein